MIRPDLPLKAAELGALWWLLDNGIAPECDNAKLVARAHGFVQ